MPRPDRRRARRCCSFPARRSRGGATRRRWRFSKGTSTCSPSTCAARAALRKAAAADPAPVFRVRPIAAEPPQNLKEYDPEWGRAFWEGTVAKSCPHEIMLTQVKVPILLTHHMHHANPDNGILFGAYS